MHPFHRTELLVGRGAWHRLQRSRVLVVGLGGVGSYAAEAIARAGVQTIGIVDFDEVCVTNLNRQLHAFRRTVGRSKAELMEARLRAINPRAELHRYDVFYQEETSEEILAPGWDWILDCIDNVTAKLHLLESAWRRKIPLVAAMGAGGRMDPTRIRVSDLMDSHTDPFARVLRKELRRREVGRGLVAVWSEEPPWTLDAEVEEAFRCICPGGDNGLHSCEDRNMIQGSISFLPASFGMTAAGVVINDLVGRPLDGAEPARLSPEESVHE